MTPTELCQECKALEMCMARMTMGQQIIDLLNPQYRNSEWVAQVERFIDRAELMMKTNSCISSDAMTQLVELRLAWEQALGNFQNPI